MLKLFKVRNFEDLKTSCVRIYRQRLNQVFYKSSSYFKFNLTMESLKNETTPVNDSMPKDNSMPVSANLNQNNMSKRALKRLLRTESIKENERKRKKAKRELTSIGSNIPRDMQNETEYYFQNGLRKVYPYYFTFCTYAKLRWYGKKIEEIYKTEFFRHKANSIEQKIKSGQIKVNGMLTTADYSIKNGDYIENNVHRHENAVTADPIEVIADNEDVVVINKPPSIPCHPCGHYRHNSVVFILTKEFGFHNLRSINRLDRLTSGVLIFCKTAASTKQFMGEIANRTIYKEYVCRVPGEFPKETIVCEQPLSVLSRTIGLYKVDRHGKDAKTTFQRICYNGRSSLVKCILSSGRTHQIRVHLQYLGYPILNDSLYTGSVWGAKGGKDGDFGKTEHQLIEDLIQEHSPENFYQKLEEPILQTTENSELQFLSTEKHKDTFVQSKLSYDEYCYECSHSFEDPKPHQLVMCLHAFKYKGSDWEFSAPLPVWANEDWKMEDYISK